MQGVAGCTLLRHEVGASYGMAQHRWHLQSEAGLYSPVTSSHLGAWRDDGKHSTLFREDRKPKGKESFQTEEEDWKTRDGVSVCVRVRKGGAQFQECLDDFGRGIGIQTIKK